MNRLFETRILLAGVLVAAASWLGDACRSSQAADAPVNFSRDILPILSDNCFHCHGQDEKARQGDLRLDTKAGALRTEEPVIVPGKSGESVLIQRITSQDADEMMPPPKSNRKLSPAQIELLKRWVDQGAAWGKHWSYEPPVRPELPKVKDAAWSKNGIDPFIRARLEQEGLQPSPAAPKEALLRRVTLDLTGLPPPLAEIDAFLADNSPDAYEKVVDWLLASPRYGQRMAWEWLDAARYADSNGYQGDTDRTMWPWRDWVVKSLNDNMPYDQFTVEQLAGDLLPNATTEQKLATGFNRNHMINGEGGRIPEENRIEYIMDQTETLATVWLGVTMTCCRCHDHKYDPFAQRDYYRMFAYFNQTPVNGDGRSGQTKPVVELVSAEQVQRKAELQKEYNELLKPLRDKEQKLKDAIQAPKEGEEAVAIPAPVDTALRKDPGVRTDAERDDLKKHFSESDAEYVAMLMKFDATRKARDQFNKSIPQVMVMEDMEAPRETFILARGAYDKPGDKVSAGVPESLPPLPPYSQPNRLALARWLVSPEQPLTARVTVNRAWQTFFGTGLVKTVEDFGVQGERPSHPELLDWLATEFVRTGWNVKALHRLLVTSATYRQASKVTPALLERDPENRLLARGPRHRLPSWMIRDQALAVSGLLVDQIGGPPVKPYQPEGIWEEATFGKISYKQDHGDALYRRSMYTFWRRIVGPTMFFDTASRQTCTVNAVRTNTPLHALVTINEPTYVEAARTLAQRVMQQAGSEPGSRVELAFRLATSRLPTAREKEILLAALEKLKESFAPDPAAAAKLLKVGESARDEKLDPIEHAAYMSLCSLILNLDEVLTRQ
jgi:hypothetical protein